MKLLFFYQMKEQAVDVQLLATLQTFYGQIGHEDITEAWDYMQQTVSHDLLLNNSLKIYIINILSSFTAVECRKRRKISSFGAPQSGTWTIKLSQKLTFRFLAVNDWIRVARLMLTSVNLPIYVDRILRQFTLRCLFSNY